jgi:hypothetical protein
LNFGWKHITGCDEATGEPVASEEAVPPFERRRRFGMSAGKCEGHSCRWELRQRAGEARTISNGRKPRPAQVAAGADFHGLRLPEVESHGQDAEAASWYAVGGVISWNLAGLQGNALTPVQRYPEWARQEMYLVELETDMSEIVEEDLLSCLVQGIGHNDGCETFIERNICGDEK